MLKPTAWESTPIDFKLIMWKGDGENVSDAPAVIHPEKQASIFKMELSEQDRRQLIEGNPIYLALLGRVQPFMASANLGEITELIRSL
jgi:hypothetical protein